MGTKYAREQGRRGREIERMRFRVEKGHKIGKGVRKRKKQQPRN